MLARLMVAKDAETKKWMSTACSKMLMFLWEIGRKRAANQWIDWQRSEILIQ